MSDETTEEGFTEPAAGEAAAKERKGKKAMGFLEHLEELRWTLIKCAITFGIFVTIIAYQLERASTVLTWPLDRVKPDFPTVLRTMQRAGDHQRMLTASGVPASDARLPIAPLRSRPAAGGPRARP